ncbi:MAG: hypothetical protein P8M07_02985 [Flavobacteriales bacterium]|nr:hypothetical protein [Flavobacteriales bacterium]
MNYSKSTIPMMPAAVVMTLGEIREMSVEKEEYIQLFDELTSSGLPKIFGIPFSNGQILSANGSLVELIAQKKDRIFVQCIGHFEATSYAKNIGPKPYAGGEIQEVNAHLDRPIDRGLRKLAEDVVALLRGHGKEVDDASFDTAAEIMTWLGMPAEQKHQLLICRGEKRRGHLYAILKWAHTVLRQEVEIKNGIFLN